MATDIVHLVVWSRYAIPTDDITGEMTPESKRIVCDFVKRSFAGRLGPGAEERVLWFKKRCGFQSVPAVEHVHVMVRDVDGNGAGEVVGEWVRESLRV
jgi:hypothetical protein